MALKLKFKAPGSTPYPIEYNRKPKTPSTMGGVAGAAKGIASGVNRGMSFLGNLGKLPNVANKTNPVVTVTPPTATPKNYSNMDYGSLQDEMAVLQYNMSRGNVDENAIRDYSRLQRELLAKSPQTQGQDYSGSINELMQRRADIEAQRRSQNSQEMSLFRQQQDAQLAELERRYRESGAREQEAVQGANSFSGFGRSSANVTQQQDIARRTEEGIMAARRAAEIEIIAKQRELEGAAAEELGAYSEQIASLRGQAEQAKMLADQNAMKVRAGQQEVFGNTLQELMANAQQSGLIPNLKDEQSLKSMISMATNADGTVNEEVLKSFATPYQALIRSGVSKGFGTGTQAVDRSKVKIQRMGGTNKNPTYGYIDPITGKITYTNSAGIPIYGGGGGGVSRGGGASTTQSGGAIENPYAYTSKYKTIPTAAERESLSAGSGKLIQSLNQVQKILNDGKYKSGKILGTIGQYDWTDVESKKAQQAFNLAAQVLGQYFEGGKLAEGDIKRYRDMLPAMTMTKETAQNTLDIVKSMVLNDYNNKLATLADARINVSGFKPLSEGVFTKKATTTAKTTTPQAGQTKPKSNLKNFLKSL